LHLIAQKADGALRDALSIFDQIVSFAGNEVTYKHVIDNLNILDYEYYFKITDYLLTGDFSNALLLLNEIIDEGFDVHHFISGLSAHFRDLLVCKDVQTISLLEVSEKTKERYKAQSQQCSAGLLFRFLEIGNRCDVEFKASQNQRLHVELALLKMCALKENAFSGMPATAALSAPAEKKTPVATSSVKSEPVITRDAVKNEPPAISPPSPLPVESIQNQSISSVSEPIAVAAPVSAPTTNVVTPASLITTAGTNPDTVSTAVRSRSGATGTISISKKLQANRAPAESQAETAPEIQLNRTIIESELVAVVKQLVERMMAEGRRQLAVALNKHEPVLIDGNIIEIPVDNPIQADDIQANKQEILFYLKEKLSNTGIEIHPRVTDTEELSGMAYTPADKFKKMAEKNPDLNQLRQQFDLELDF
jgi:DNA polymerase III subunit gamma/tau